MESEDFPARWYPRPSGELGPALAQATLEGVKASLHVESGEALWLRIERDADVLFELIGDSTMVTGRTGDRGPHFLAGSWTRRSPRVRQVMIERGDAARVEGVSSAGGWLCLLPGAAKGALRVVWLDDDGSEYEALEHPPVEDAGVVGPTFYGPPRTQSSGA